MFELYSRNFLMAEFWALTILLFAFAMLVAEGVGLVEKRVEFYAGVRQ
jgi:NitT/TauT family transport system permease protein